VVYSVQQLLNAVSPTLKVPIARVSLGSNWNVSGESYNPDGMPFVGGPGCGKTHLIAYTANRLIQEGRRIIVLAQTNANLFDLTAKILRRSERKLHVQSFAFPTKDDLTNVPEVYHDAFVAWIEKTKQRTIQISDSVDLIVATAGGILDSTKRAQAVSNFSELNDITVIIDKASQIEHISALGLIGLQSLRSHVIMCGDPWQISRVIQNDTDGVMSMSDTSLMHLFRDHNVSCKFVAASHYMKEVGITPTWNFLTETFRLYTELCQWGDKELYHLGSDRGNFTSRKGSKGNCIEIYTIENAFRDSIVYVGSSRCNIYEIGVARILVERLISQSIPCGDIVVLSAYEAHVGGIKAFLGKMGVFGVQCSTIHTFNGNERDHVIVSLAGGIPFLDQETLIHSIMTRSKEKLYVIMSRFYENAIPQHALARFLRSTLPDKSVFRRISLSPEQRPSMAVDVGVTSAPTKQLKNLVTTESDMPMPAINVSAQQSPFYSPPERFRVEIVMLQVVHALSSDLTVAIGSISSKFLDTASDTVHYSGKLSDGAAFSSSTIPYAASNALLCQQLAKCAGYLIPSRVYTNKYCFRNNCEGINLRFHRHANPDLICETHIEHALNALNDYSAITVRSEIHDLESYPDQTFEKYVLQRFAHTDGVSEYNRGVTDGWSHLCHEGDCAAWANHSGGVIAFNQETMGFTELLRSNHMTEPSLGQSVYFLTEQGR